MRTGLVLQSLAPRQPFSRGSSVELRPAPKLRPARSSLPVERTTLSKFSEFGLSAPIQKALHAEGYEIPTPIQSQAIPHIMAGRDLCGIAQTGTGKTAAFALPILHQFAEAKRRPERRACRALVLSPTRELASQIAESFQTYGRNLGLSVTVAYGGVTIGKQERALSNGVDILVATPGRLLDLVERRSLSLREVEVFVLDEADRMLDLGFIHDLRRIVKLLPSERQTLFFSATMPAVIASLAEAFLKNPVQVAVAPIATTAERIAQSVMFVPTSQKLAALQAVLKDPSVERALVFTRTKHGADKVVRGLAAGRVSAAAIHGNKSQPQRERALAGFRSGQCRVLVATDIAARGIDVDGVSHVINFDLPNVPEILRPSHRPDGAGRRRRYRDLVLQRRGARLSTRHREAHTAEGAGGAPPRGRRRPAGRGSAPGAAACRRGPSARWTPRRRLQAAAYRPPGRGAGPQAPGAAR